MMWAFAFCMIGIISGFILFRKKNLPQGYETEAKGERLSVIIPARDEEANLPHLLESLKAQSVVPDEIIVVDDSSVDNTREIAESYGVRVIANEPLPAGWTGKNWAIWNGFRQATGDLILFLDADIRLKPKAVGALIKAREAAGGVISAVPYHYTEKFYERLAFVTNILSSFAFLSPFEYRNPQQGLYGPCILTTRSDYERAGGHEGIRSEVLDDLSLGATYKQAGLPVTNFTGYGLVSFRMYPGGIKSELEGFSKSAVQGAAQLRIATVIPVALWLLGLIATEGVFFLWHTSLFYPLAASYVLYALQIIYFLKFLGKFGWWMPLAHILSLLFFLVTFLYSVYQVVFLKRVVWKGRTIEVGGGKNK